MQREDERERLRDESDESGRVPSDAARQRAEDALKASEEKYRELVENANSIIMRRDISGRIIFFNEFAESFFGYRKDEIIGRPVVGTILPERDSAGRDMRAMIREINTHPDRYAKNENENIRRNGERVWISWTNKAIRDQAGKVREILCIGNDITYRKQAEEALKESERRIRQIVENSPVAIAVYRNNQETVMVNRRFTELFGYTIEDLPDTDRWWTLAYPDPRYREKVRASWNAFVVQAVESRTLFKPVESWVVCRDGSVCNIEFYFSFVGENNLVTFIDLTERRKVLKALRENEKELQRQNSELIKTKNFLQNILDGSVEGITTTNLEGEILFQNPQLLDVTGYEESEVIGKKVHQFYGGGIEDAETVMQALREEGSLRNHEMKLRKKNGELLDIILSASLLKDEKDRVVGTIGVYRDITDWRRLESQLIQAQKMEAIGTLAGGIAHDFNNLLMGIQGYTSLMLLNMNPGDLHYDRLKSIEEQVQSGAGLTKQLLGFARGGRYEIRPADLNEVLERTSVLFGRTKKEITIHRKFDEDLWSAEVDRGQIEQVLLNLYVNAWQAMPAGGELYLETRNVALDPIYSRSYSVAPGRYVKISVTDTGVGMDEKTKKRIFEPFFTTKEMGRGTGLGLATVYGIIKGHKGIITVYSEKGHGTTFSLYLPSSGEKVVHETVSAEEPLKGTETVLVIDDEEVVLDVTRDILKSLGYRVLTAVGGEEALAIYRSHKNDIAVVILDMIMPRMSGGETFDLLKAINPEVRVILSSGYSLNGQAAGIMEKGCRAFIQKPFSLKDLSLKIRSVLDNPPFSYPA